MNMPSVGRFPAAAAALALLAGARVAAQDSPPVTRICLAPATVEASSGTASSAMDAARRWKFNPGMRNGQKVGGAVLVPVKFTPPR